MPALYYDHPGSTPMPLTCRVHTKAIKQGDQKGTSFGYAEVVETDPFLVFLKADLPEPRRGAVVVMVPRLGQPASEGFRLDHSEVPDGITIKCKVIILSEDEAAAIYPATV